MGHRVRLPMARLVYQLTVWTSALKNANLSRASAREKTMPTQFIGFQVSLLSLILFHVSPSSVSQNIDFGFRCNSQLKTAKHIERQSSPHQTVTDLMHHLLGGAGCKIKKYLC